LACRFHRSKRRDFPGEPVRQKLSSTPSSFARRGAFMEPLQKIVHSHTRPTLVSAPSGSPTREIRDAHKTRDFSSLHTHRIPERRPPAVQITTHAPADPTTTKNAPSTTVHSWMGFLLFAFSLSSEISTSESMRDLFKAPKQVRVSLYLEPGTTSCAKVTDMTWIHVAAGRAYS